MNNTNDNTDSNTFELFDYLNDEKTELDMSGVPVVGGLTALELPSLANTLQELTLINSRLHSMDGLVHLPNLKKLVLRQNLLTKIECVDAPALVHLDLYDNKISRLESLDLCPKLVFLDISFNNCRQIENIGHLADLEELYLIANKLTELPDPAQFAGQHPRLRLLELGANRLRSVPPAAVAPLANSLHELWLGKNKLTAIQPLPLPNVTKMSWQSNRLIEIGPGLAELASLQELYLSHNGILKIDEHTLDSQAHCLRVLDLSNNRLSSLCGLPTFAQLEELWVNDNQLTNGPETERELERLPSSVNTLYMERNPLSRHPQYRNKIIAAVPSLTQLDATPVIRPSILSSSTAKK